MQISLFNQAMEILNNSVLSVAEKRQLSFAYAYGEMSLQAIEKEAEIYS